MVVGRVVVVVGGACLLAFGGPMAVAADEPLPSVPLVEATTCAAPTGDVSVTEVGAGQTLVSFDVPAMTRVRLSLSGAVAAVSTNTGCAPRAGDVFVVEAGRDASADERAVALSLADAGDWREPGAWHVVLG